MATVVAVVSNFIRPNNVAPICRRLNEQSCDVIVADNGPLAARGHYGAWVQAGATDIWSWRVNSGPPARWYPALAVMYRYKYIMFVDDDFMPREGLVRSLLEQAETCGDAFSAIGRIGRTFRQRRDGRWRYVRRNVRDGDPMHMAGGGEFIVAERLTAAVEFRNMLARAGAAPDMLWHDDMILDCGIQWFHAVMPYRAAGGWAERKMDGGGYAFNATAAYRDVRDGLIDLCYKCGWRPLDWVDWREGADGS